MRSREKKYSPVPSFDVWMLYGRLSKVEFKEQGGARKEKRSYLSHRNIVVFLLSAATALSAASTSAIRRIESKRIITDKKNSTRSMDFYIPLIDKNSVTSLRVI